MAPFDRLGKITAFDVAVDAGARAGERGAYSLDIYQSVIDFCKLVMLHSDTSFFQRP